MTVITRRYKNGNITLKAEPEDFEGREDVFTHALWALGDCDCELFGEEYCLSNYDMAVDLYCCYNDKLLRFPFSLEDDLKAGKTVRLYARNLTADDREEYDRLVAAGEL
jgi:hypothetical protein